MKQACRPGDRRKTKLGVGAVFDGVLFWLRKSVEAEDGDSEQTDDAELSYKISFHLQAYFTSYYPIRRTFLTALVYSAVAVSVG